MEKTSSKTLPSKPGFGGRLPFRKIAPNIVTMLALCAGVTSIRYSVQEDWVKAVICIFLAALFDGLDGRCPDAERFYQIRCRAGFPV